jgi:hypothetical protein
MCVYSGPATLLGAGHYVIGASVLDVPLDVEAMASGSEIRAASR